MIEWLTPAVWFYGISVVASFAVGLAYGADRERMRRRTEELENL